MNWTCDKCGKQMELSQEQLVETGGAVVCPQCLNSSVIPGFERSKESRATSYVAAITPSKTVPPIPSQTMANNSTTPPARRQTISFVETPSRTTPPPHQRHKPPTTPLPKIISQVFQTKRFFRLFFYPPTILTAQHDFGSVEKYWGRLK